jgi:cobalamin biosynthesis Mg chelatase CobN
MRRLPHRALVCALLCLLLGGAPALAADSHHHTSTDAKHTSTLAKHTTTPAKHTATVKATATSASGATSGSGGKATTKNGLTVLNDCQNHGQLTHNYPVSWLRKALSMMSSDTAQYSNCSTVLHQAILHSVHPGSGGSSSSSTTTIVIIVVIVLLILAALLGVLALRRRRSGEPPASA